MAFPQSWIPDVILAQPLNVSPCWVDIIGFDGDNEEATYHQFDDDNVYFRIRLNGDPLTNNPNNPIENAVWGVEIRDGSNALLFTARVNGSGNTDELQILDASGSEIYSEDIVLQDIITPENVNVEVSIANTTTECPNNLDDYFLDFRLPKNQFIISGNEFDFDTETYKFCYFTSENANNINKEQPLCGPIINPPSGGFLNVNKIIESGPNPIEVNTEGTWVLLITVSNPSTETVNNVEVVDNILNSETTVTNLNASQGTAVESPTGVITWTVGTLTPQQSETLRITITGTFTTTGCRILNSGIVTGDNVPSLTFQDMGICVVAVPPSRGIDLFAHY